ncbi:hypothetical protein CMI37_08200 [Candidatus Pacearchaeota archaeon]|nr:hypothetical protein [Candidatus Pacearchaeota archaeon]
MDEHRACVNCDELYHGPIIWPTCVEATGEPVSELIEIVEEVVRCIEEGQPLSPAIYIEAVGSLEKASLQLKKSTPNLAQF